MAVIAETQPAQLRARLATNEEARKEFAKDLLQLLAVAEEAQTHGVDKTPEMKRQLDFQRTSIIAQHFFQEQGETGPNFTDQDVDEFFKQPGNQQKFDQVLEDAKKSDPQLAAQQIPPEEMARLKQR
jgi:hypothetical protein